MQGRESIRTACSSETQAVAPSRRKLPVLRLDDGSCIGLLDPEDPDRVVRIDIERVCDLGRAGKAIQHLEAILEHLRQAGYQVAPPETHALTPLQMASKNWVSSCKYVLRDILDSPVYDCCMLYSRVDPEDIPDYYHIIKQPIFLIDVEEKLMKNEYTGANDFYLDMKQIFRNVKLYNPPGSKALKIGEMAEKNFEEVWSTTGSQASQASQASARPSHDQPGGSGRQVQSMLQQIRNEHMPHLLSLLPQELVMGLETQDIELDFDALDDGTRQRIVSWLRHLFQPPPHA